MPPGVGGLDEAGGAGRGASGPGLNSGGPARRRQYLQAKWIPQGWQWVDPEKQFKALLVAMRSGLMSRSEAISAIGYDAEDVDAEIAADNRRADGVGLVFDSDPRQGPPGGASAQAKPQTDTPGSDRAAT